MFSSRAESRITLELTGLPGQRDHRSSEPVWCEARRRQLRSNEWSGSAGRPALLTSKSFISRVWGRKDRHCSSSPLIIRREQLNPKSGLVKDVFSWLVTLSWVRRVPMFSLGIPQPKHQFQNISLASIRGAFQSLGAITLAEFMTWLFVYELLAAAKLLTASQVLAATNIKTKGANKIPKNGIKSETG